MYALYWDESDPGVPEVKVRRAIYASLEEARAQAEHDMLCLRCRVLENGRLTLESTGKMPHSGPGRARNCPDCDGSGLNPSKNILRIEKLDKVDRNTMNPGEVVWEPGKETK